MMKNSYDVIVIGVGGWGSAALWQLARRGLAVCGIEQFAIGHDRGSSHGDSRIIRMAYFAHPDYVPLLRRAYALWRELEEESGALMTLNGLLCIGEPNGALIRGLEECYASHEIEHERLSPAEAMRRFPQFAMDEDADELVCYWDHHGGFLRPEACIRAHVDGAIRAGAALLEGEAVVAIKPVGDDVEVRTTQRTLMAHKVVVTVGAYASRLLGPAIPVQPVRKVLFWYAAPDPRAFAPGRFPCWIARVNERNFYGFPTLDGIAVKAAEDTGGEPLTDAMQIERELRAEDEANLRPFLNKLFGSRIGERVRHKTCLYEKSADDHFIVDAHPEQKNVIVAVGGSGHGFKFCSVIGELVADLATGVRAGRDIDPGRPGSGHGPELFRASRLRGGSVQGS